MAFITQAVLAKDLTFRDRVRLAVVDAAVDIMGEAKNAMSDQVYGKRQELAGLVMNDSNAYVDRFSWAVAQNGAVAAGAPVSVTGSTNANPIVVTTATNHGFSSGDTVVLAGHSTNTAANGAWVITVLSATTFSIPAAGVGVGTGGTVVKQPPDDDIAFTVAAVWNDIARVRGTD